MSLEMAQKDQIMLNAIVMIVMLSSAAPVFAEQPIAAPRSAARFGALRPAQSDPYRRLFEPQKAAPQPAADNPRVARPEIVCGMRILPADPKNVPSMLIAPKIGGIDYTIRAIDPPICNPAR